MAAWSEWIIRNASRWPLPRGVPQAPELNVTGVVSADVSRSVPVVSMASGRIVEIRARLGDNVTKGQILMRVAKRRPRRRLLGLPAGRGRREAGGGTVKAFEDLI